MVEEEVEEVKRLVLDFDQELRDGMSYFSVSLSHGDHLEYNKIPI